VEQFAYVSFVSLQVLKRTVTTVGLTNGL